jgi:transcriptional regulator with XRE-family HTH domain
MEITGEMIKASRERQRMTQQELADEVGVSLRTVGSWERGETVPRNRIGAIAEALDLEIPGQREYGQQAIKRRIGVLAKMRREQLGYGRIPFARDAGIGSDSMVLTFEFAKSWPRPATLRKFEAALGWKVGITEDILHTQRVASSITLEDLDDPAYLREKEFASEDEDEVGGAPALKLISTPQLLEELIFRLEQMKARATMTPSRDELYGRRLKGKGNAPGADQHHFDLAASDDHVEGEDDND